MSAFQRCEGCLWPLDAAGWCTKGRLHCAPCGCPFKNDGSCPRCNQVVWDDNLQYYVPLLQDTQEDMVAADVSDSGSDSGWDAPSLQWSPTPPPSFHEFESSSDSDF